LFTILAILALVGSVLITLIVLLQNSKGGGLASNFAAGNQTFGVRQTTDILEKITWGLAIFILIVSIAASFTYDDKEETKSYSDLLPAPTTPVMPAGEGAEATVTDVPQIPLGDMTAPEAAADAVDTGVAAAAASTEELS
jgi:preprotein translocase subunit SecG